MSGAVFVAGGSGGLGGAICEDFAARGIPVVFSYHRNHERAKELQERLSAAGVESVAQQLDLTDAIATSHALNAAAKRFGLLHGVVYAAGPAFEMAFVSKISPQSWADVFAQDVNGCFNLFSAALPLLRQQKSGCLLALSTCALKRPPRADVLSAAPKAAIDMLVKCIAKEEGRNNIRANTVELGFIDAGIAAHHIQNVWTPEIIEGIKTETPLRRFGTAQEIARAVGFLCSDEASFITGQSLAVDGGYQL